MLFPGAGENALLNNSVLGNICFTSFYNCAYGTRPPPKKNSGYSVTQDCYQPFSHYRKEENIELNSKVSEVTQSCPTLCDPMDFSPPGSSIHGILQARVLEWVAISFSILTKSKI